MKRSVYLPLLVLLASALAPTLLPAQRTLSALQLDSASARLDRFAGTLAPVELALWEELLRRAAAAPAPGRDVRIVAIRRTGSGGTCGSAGVIDAGRRVDQPAFVSDLLAGVFQAVIDRSIQQMEEYQKLIDSVAESVEDFRGSNVAARGDRDELVSRYPAAERQPDASRALARRLAELTLVLPDEDRAALEWLLTRAVVAPPARASAIPDPLGPVSLREALGINTRARRRAPAPITAAEVWTLRC
jgi:hypothetical protein